MRLFLASEARHPDTIEKLKKYIGGFEGKSIAYIPTAQNGESNFRDWEENSTTWKLVNTLGAKVTSIQLEDYKSPDVVEQLKGKDIIWVAGGACGYLMYWILRTQLDKNIKEVLESGSLYVGSSAGSMITGNNLDIAEWFEGEEEHGIGFMPGLNLVDFDILPHFEESQLDYIKKNYKGKKLYLIKDGEEILFEDVKVTVQGEERIITSA